MIFEVNRKAEINVIRDIGPDNISLVIIDDFYENPDDVRDFAANLPRKSKEDFPNIVTGIHKRRICEYNPLIKISLKSIYDLLTSGNYWTVEKDHDNFNRKWDMMDFLCNIMREDEMTGGCPHMDNIDVQWGSVIYLNTPKECAGGTGFFSYRGKMTADKVDMIPCDIEGKGDVEDWVSRDIGPWKLEAEVEMKYNRMVLYEAKYLHSQIFKKGMFNEFDRINQVFFM